MIALLVAVAVAHAAEAPAAEPAAAAPPAQAAKATPPRPDPFVPSGNRVTQVGGTHGVSIGTAAVVGAGGGTHVTTLGARYADRDFSVAVRLPLAAYRATGGRQTDLGNLFLEGLYLFERPGLFGGGEWHHAVGIEAHFNPGGTPYTWLHRADELWPGMGANLVYQIHVPAAAGLDVSVRGLVGMHAARDYEPYPGLFAQIGAAGLVDWTLPVASQVGLVGEMAFTYWDLSPWELTALVRFDPVAGVRLRGGALLPMASWLGWTPSQLDRGLDELTLHLDAQMAF